MFFCGQQLALGLISGIAEGVGEAISLGNVGKLAEQQLAEYTFKTVGKKLGANILLNATQEMVTEGIGIAADLLILDDKGALQRYADAFRETHPNWDVPKNGVIAGWQTNKPSPGGGRLVIFIMDFGCRVKPA